MCKHYILGGLLITTGIILGAFGAHYLRETLQLPATKIDSWQTGVHYQLFSGLGILILGLLNEKKVFRTNLSVNLIGTGSILFSFSIYALALNTVWNIEWFKYIFGPITPIGGLLMISGWAIFTLKSFSKKETIS